MESGSKAEAVEVVTLRGGVTVPLAALQLLWGLEARAFEITALADGCLHVRPKARLTTEDRDAIRRHRTDLVTLVRYCDGDQTAVDESACPVCGRESCEDEAHERNRNGHRDEQQRRKRR